MNERNKIKVCYLVSSLCNEGPVNVMYNIIKYIDFSIFDISIITFIPEKSNSRIDEFRKFPIEIYQLSPDKLLSLISLYKRLKQQVKIIDPDELHAHCPRSLYLMPFLSKKYKKIYTIHIYPGEQQVKLYGAIKGRIVIALNHFFTKRCDLPIACAESVAWQYKKHKNWDVVAVPNGCSLPIWKYDESEKERLRNEFGMKKELKYFIFIGRFSKEKNPDILFHAFKNVKRKDIGLVMLGTGPMWDSLKRDCPDNILMPGFTTRVYDYMKASDFYISVSDVEGLANTILESMSVGLPMLLSDIPSHKEVLDNVDKNKTVGYIVDKFSSKDIYEKINLLYKLDREQVCHTVQKLYKRKYTAEIMSRSYQKEYLNIMQKEL